MSKKKFRVKPKQILSLILVFALLITGIAGIAAFTNRETKKVSSGIFKKGTLDASGQFSKSEKHLYTDLFECQGLSITQDFESDSTYEVFYYRVDKSFIGSTGKISGNYEKIGFENAKYARVLLIPVLDSAEDKISFYEIHKYAKDLEIIVSKKQNFTPSTLQVFPGIEDTFGIGAVLNPAYTVVPGDAPFVLMNSLESNNLTIFENKSICKVGVPVSLIKDISKDAVFTLRVVSGNGTTAFKEVSKHQLVIKAGTYTDLTQVTDSDCVASMSDIAAGKYLTTYKNYYKVNEWVYFDVNIEVKPGQTLAFGDDSDTIAFAYYRDINYPFYSNATTTPGNVNEISIYFDIIYYE